MAIEASIVVEFGTSDPSDDDILVIELDDKHPNNLDSDDKVKSQFSPGPPADKPVFLIHHAPTVEITEIVLSSGSINLIGSSIKRDRELDLQWINDEENPSTGYWEPTLNSGDITFYGNSFPVKVDGTKIVPSTVGKYPAVAKATVEVNFNWQYMLTPPSMTLADDETYPISIVVYAKVIES